MSELFKIVLTASLTICGGVLVAVISQAFIRLVVEPIVLYFGLKAEIKHALLRFAVLANQEEEKKEAQETYYKLSLKLRTVSAMILWYRLWSLLGFVPSPKQNYEASAGLNALGNLVFTEPADPKVRPGWIENRDENRKRVGRALGLPEFK